MLARSLAEFARSGSWSERYTALQSMFDRSVPHGWHYYWKSVELPPLTDAAIKTLVEHASALTSPRSYCIVFQLGGALGRVAEGAPGLRRRNYERLVELKRAYDPTNFFRLNQNIAP